jgi:hypothetical protein
MAIGKLLTETSVAIYFVDISKSEESWDSEEVRVYPKHALLAFTDHGGGSESDWKVLINKFDLDVPKQYVLYSPPDAEGRSSNLTFHEAEFSPTMLEPTGTRDFLPNPEKRIQKK